MARPAEFESATSASGGQRSIQLSYGRLTALSLCVSLVFVQFFMQSLAKSSLMPLGVAAASMGVMVAKTDTPFYLRYTR